MKTSRVENVIVEFFREIDEKRWELATKNLLDKVQINYAIDHLGVPVLLPAKQLMNSWQSSLCGFTITQHQLANFQIEEQLLEAQVKCYGTITHYLPHYKGNTWRVIGNYEFQLQKEREDWKISTITFFFKYQDGNLELPKIAKLAIN